MLSVLLYDGREGGAAASSAICYTQTLRSDPREELAMFRDLDFSISTGIEGGGELTFFQLIIT